VFVGVHFRVGFSRSYSALATQASEHKSSRAWLGAFALQWLRGEGDIARHLHFLGYTLAFEQTPLQEYEWRATSLAVDLRDGVRLARLAELMTKRAELCKVCCRPVFA
jgi:abnormal spindle-like microcephaly-associated protein